MMFFVGLQLNLLQAAENSMWSKDISDPYWKVQKAVIDKARGPQLQTILDLKRPEGSSDLEWDVLKNAVNNSLLNNEVVCAPRQNYQVEAVDRSRQSDRVVAEDISIAELANNAVRMYPHLVEGFTLLKLEDSDLPSLREFMKQELAANHGDNAFAVEIEKAEDIIIGGMKDRFFQILLITKEQKDKNVLYSLDSSQDPILNYVLKYSTGMKRPDRSFTNNNQFMLPTVVRWQDNEGRSLLHFAGLFNSIDIAQSLIDAGATVNAKNNNQLTPLHYAAIRNVDKVASLLLAAGATVNARSDNQCTPLHLAAGYNADKVMPLLLAAGATVNARDNYQNTPLHYAAANNADKVVPLLLAAGANVHA